MGDNHHHYYQTETHQKTQRKSWEPRTKLIAGFFFVFGVITLNNLWLLSAALIFSASFVLWSGLTLGQLFKRLSVLVPFLALMSLPLIFGAGFPLSEDRVVFAALISLKALTAMTFIIFVFINQPIEEMLEAMEHLKVPSAITTVIYLAYRYGFLFVQNIQTTMWALKSRLFTPSLSRDSLLIYGELAGGLLIKSIYHSDIVYRAMTSRCFQGSMPVEKPSQIEISDILKTSVPLIFIFSLIIFEQAVM